MDEWLKGKRQHLRLSLAAATAYDECYEKSSFATGSYMRYERALVETFARRAPSRSRAVDLGCGTGRTSFLLAPHFERVHGYDFSPDMIRVAREAARRRALDHVRFESRDVEAGAWPLEAQSVDFVNTSFGMGSFVRDPAGLVAEAGRVLRPGGLAVFSFYNARALVNDVALAWRPALAARLVEGSDALDVEFGGQTFRIAARAYETAEVERLVGGAFDLLSLTTFPTLSALFPQAAFDDERVRRLCWAADTHLSTDVETAHGFYIIAVVERSRAASKGRARAGHGGALRPRRRRPDDRGPRAAAPPGRRPPSRYRRSAT
jgi:SAM-dependent methyltransferase